MKTYTIILIIISLISLILGFLLYTMIKNVCGCKADVVEGTDTESINNKSNKVIYNHEKLLEFLEYMHGEISSGNITTLYIYLSDYLKKHDYNFTKNDYLHIIDPENKSHLQINLTDEQRDDILSIINRKKLIEGQSAVPTTTPRSYPCNLSDKGRYILKGLGPEYDSEKITNIEQKCKELNTPSDCEGENAGGGRFCVWTEPTPPPTTGDCASEFNKLCSPEKRGNITCGYCATKNQYDLKNAGCDNKKISSICDATGECAAEFNRLCSDESLGKSCENCIINNVSILKEKCYNPYNMVDNCFDPDEDPLFAFTRHLERISNPNEKKSVSKFQNPFSESNFLLDEAFAKKRFESNEFSDKLKIQCLEKIAEHAGYSFYKGINPGAIATAAAKIFNFYETMIMCLEDPDNFTMNKTKDEVRKGAQLISGARLNEEELGMIDILVDGANDDYKEITKEVTDIIGNIGNFFGSIF